MGGPIPEITTEAPVKEPDITTEAPGNDLGPLPEITPDAPGVDLDITTDITQETASNNLELLSITTEEPGNNPGITTKAPGNDPDIATESPGNDLGPIPDVTTEQPGNDPGIATVLPSNDPGPIPAITTEAPGNDPDITTEAHGNDLGPPSEITTKATGNGPDVATKAPGNDLGPLPDITTEAPGNDMGPDADAPGNDLGPIPEKTPEAPGNNPDVTTDITQETAINDLGPLQDLTTEEPGNELEPIPEVTPEAPGNEPEINIDTTQDEAGNDLGSLPEITSKAPSNNMGPIPDITTGAASNDISSFQVDNIISYVTEVELPSGEIVDEQNDIEDGIVHQSNGPQTEEPGAVVGGADQTAGATTQSVVIEDILANSDEEVEDLSQPDELDAADNNAGVSSQSADTGGAAGLTEAFGGASVDPEETTTQLFGTNEDVMQQEGGAGTTLQISSGTVVIGEGGSEGPAGLEEQVTADGPGEEAATSGSMEEERSSTRQPHSWTTAQSGGSAEEAGEDAITEVQGEDLTTFEEGRSSTRQPHGLTTAQYGGIVEEIGGEAITEVQGGDLTTSEEEAEGRISTRQPVHQTTGQSSGIEEGTPTEEHDESDENLITTVEPEGNIQEDRTTEEPNDHDARPEVTPTPHADSTREEASSDKPKEANTNAVGGSTGQHIEVVVESSSSAQPDGSYEEANTSTVGDSSVIDSSSTKQPSGADEEANANTIGGSSMQTSDDTHKEEATDSASTKQSGAPGEDGHADAVGGSTGQSHGGTEDGAVIEITKDQEYVAISTTLGTNTVKTSATNKILLTTKNQEALPTIQPAHDNTEAVLHALDGEALTISDSYSGSQPYLTDGDTSTTSLQPDFTVASGNAGTTSQTSGVKAETSSKPNNGQDAVGSSKPTTQVGGAGKPTDFDTISTHGFAQTVLPTLSNAGEETQSTAPSHAAETSTSSLAEADVVINLKTVASNIIPNTINIDDGGNDLTTRQFTLYTGSTNDDMIPDQTRHNDLQDLTTKTTENMISETDILTQDSSQTNDHDKESTIHIQTTTDNSLSEGQAPELNPSLPGSPTYVSTNENFPTYVNTNANNLLGETKHPLSTQTMPLTIEENESNSEEEEISKGPTKQPTWADTTLDSGNPIEIQFEDDDNQHPATPEPDQELNINLAQDQDLTPESPSSTSTSTTPCICPSTSTTSFGTTTTGSSTTTTGTTTASGDCLCPDIILGPAEVEASTDLPVTSGGRRRREWDDDDLYVDDFDQKILKKMPFLKFY